MRCRGTSQYERTVADVDAGCIGGVDEAVLERGRAQKSAERTVQCCSETLVNPRVEAVSCPERERGDERVACERSRLVADGITADNQAQFEHWCEEAQAWLEFNVARG